MRKSMKDVARWVLASSRWLPVAGGIVYLVLWIVAEAGRWQLLEKTVVFALLAVAIALSGLLPLVSLGLVVGIPALQLLGVLYPPDATSWPMYAAAGFVALVIGFRGEGWARKLVLPASAIASVLIAIRMMLPSEAGYWTSWTGGTTRLPAFSGYPHRTDFVSLLLLGLGFCLGMWALGLAARSLLRERAIGHVLTAAESRLVETDFELRLSQDRARISRDVHDALAHSLAVILSQAEGALALQGQKPKVSGDALRNIASVGRSALIDVRNLVERIHDDDLTAAAPRSIELDDVVVRMRGLGMDASLHILGTPVPLSPSRDLAVFRIVQESLTNALKHAGPTSAARVTLDWQGAGLAILVISEPNGAAPTPQAGRGVGIAGMKERARLAGGWLTAEAADGEFVVTAFIPARRAAAEVELVDA